MHIYNKIRALVDPYPNAFTKVNFEKLEIHEGIPVSDISNSYAISPGKILSLTSDNKILVQTGDGAFLITRFRFNTAKVSLADLHVGQFLESVSEKQSLRNIFSRHTSQYPSLSINPALIDFSNSI